MIETKDITKMVSHILKRDKGIADTQMMHPVREWCIGLSIATLIVAAGSLFCVQIYRQYSLEAARTEPVIAPAVPYQAAAVESAIKQYEAQAQKYGEILGGQKSVSSEIASSTIVTVPTETETPSETQPPVAVDDVPAPVEANDTTVSAPVLAP